jgi:hypothetical protein
MSRKTVLALLVFLVLLGVVYYLQTRPDKGERRGERPRPVPRLSESQIKQVTVTAKGATVVLERSGKAWRVTAPIEDEADSYAAKTMAEKLTGLEFGDMVTERKDRRAEQKVDRKGGIHVVVSDGQKTVADFYLGKVADGFTMLRAAGKDQIYQAVGALTHAFEREVKNWRERTIVELRQQDVRQLEVTTSRVPGAGTIVLSRPDEKTDWKVVRSDTEVAELDKSTVSGLLSGLGNLSAFDFADGAKPDQTGLGAPTATLVAHLKGGKRTTLLIGNREGDDYWVQEKSAPQVFVVKKYAIDSLLRRPIDFREKIVLRFSARDVASLSIQNRTAKSSVTLTRKGEDWLGDGKKVKDTTKLKAALDTLATLRGEGFAWPSAEELGLDRPGWVVEVRLKDRTRHTLAVGSVEKDSLFGLRLAGKPEIFTFRKYTLDRFLLDPASYR